jgi:hypothetical protein
LVFFDFFFEFSNLVAYIFCGYICAIDNKLCVAHIEMHHGYICTSGVAMVAHTICATHSSNWCATNSLFSTSGDWKKVVHQGPWTFRGWAILIEDYDGKEDPENIPFGGLFVWAQIHGIPKLYRKPDVVDDLARRVGKTKEVQMSLKLFYEGNYVRFRVMIDVNSSLKRVVSLNVEGEGKKWCFIKYEKVPFFCKHCGHIGHNHEVCGDGVWSIKELQYGDFMLAMR